MKILTIATKNEGYFELLKQTAIALNYSLKVLGWEQQWKGFDWKLKLYVDELEKCNKDEPIVCVDGYDVIVTGFASEMKTKFIQTGKRIIFSGQRYFPEQKWIRNIVDRLMSNSSEKIIGKTDDLNDYSRPCLGLFVGYAGDLRELFLKLIALEKEVNVNNDQVLLNIFYLQHPNSIDLDSKCEMFQNLWRTKFAFYGSISPKSPKCEIEIIKVDNLLRIKNKQFGTMPCFMHGPFNLDMHLILQKLEINPPKIGFQKGLSYWNYSIWHHIKRALAFYWKELF